MFDFLFFTLWFFLTVSAFFTGLFLAIYVVIRLFGDK